MQIVCNMKRSPEKQKEFDGINTEPIITFNIGKIYAAVILDIRNKKITGHYPVKVRVTDENKKQYYWNCTSLTPLEYHKLHSKHHDNYTRKNMATINAYWENFKAILIDLVNKEGFNRKKMDQRILGGSKESVIDAFNAKIKILDKKGKVGSVVWFTGARNSIQKYIGKDEDLKFSEITVDWLDDYTSFLRKEVYDSKGKLIVKAKKDTTISIIMRALRVLMNEAREEGIVKQYPFGLGKNLYMIPSSEGRVIGLSEDQIKEIARYPLSEDAKIYRRLWLFSYYCNGVNIGDMLRFKYRDMVKEDGQYFIQWRREKTKGRSKKPITGKALIRPEMQKIIDLHGNTDRRPDSYIFPYLRHNMTPKEERDRIQNLIHTINKKMTRIGTALGYGKITTYWARHAFTNNSLMKGVSMFSLSKALTHTDTKTTQGYAGRISNVQIIKDANVLDTVEI